MLRDEINIHFARYRHHKNKDKLVEYYLFYMLSLHEYNCAMNDSRYDKHGLRVIRQRMLRYKKRFFEFYNEK